MRLKNIDLIVAMVVVALNVVWAFFSSRIPVIGIILALPLIFILPGYTLTESVFYKPSTDVSERLILKPRLKLGRPLDALERLILSLGLSITIDMLGGLLLNLLPSGLQALSWTAFLGLLTAVFSLLAAYFRRKVPAHNTALLQFRFTAYDGVLFGLAAMVVIASILYAVIGAAQQQYPGFTQLWMLPLNQSDNNCAVRLGVRSYESTAVTYRITMTVNGVQATTWPSVILAPQEEWDRLVPITANTLENQSVEVQLYRSDQPGMVYRHVHLMLPGSKGSKVPKALQCGT